MPRTALDAATDPALRVELVGQQPGPHLQEVDQIVGEFPYPLDYTYLRDLTRRSAEADVLHLPRLAVLTDGISGPRIVARVLRFGVELRRHRTALVRTLASGDLRRDAGRWMWLGNKLLNLFATELVVSDAADRPRGRRATVIPHRSFQGRFTGYPLGERVPGRVLTLSPGRLAHSAIDLATLFEGADTSATLRVVGHVQAGEAELIERAAQARPQVISTHLDRTSDGTEISEISQADLVLLYRIRSQADLIPFFMALSVGRPVLVRDTEQTRRLAALVGSDWVRLYEGDLTTATVEEAAAAVRTTPPQGRPNLAGRDHETVAAAYADVFRSAAARVRR